MGKIELRQQLEMILTPEEEAVVTGGVGTTTICTVPSTIRPADGDPGEC